MSMGRLEMHCVGMICRNKIRFFAAVSWCMQISQGMHTGSCPSPNTHTCARQPLVKKKTENFARCKLLRIVTQQPLQQNCPTRMLRIITEMIGHPDAFSTPTLTPCTSMWKSNKATQRAQGSASCASCVPKLIALAKAPVQLVKARKGINFATMRTTIVLAIGTVEIAATKNRIEHTAKNASVWIQVSKRSNTSRKRVVFAKTKKIAKSALGLSVILLPLSWNKRISNTLNRFGGTPADILLHFSFPSNFCRARILCPVMFVCMWCERHLCPHACSSICQRSISNVPCMSSVQFRNNKAPGCYVNKQGRLYFNQQVDTTQNQCLHSSTHESSQDVICIFLLCVLQLGSPKGANWDETNLCIIGPQPCTENGKTCQHGKCAPEGDVCNPGQCVVGCTA